MVKEQSVEEAVQVQGEVESEAAVSSIPPEPGTNGMTEEEIDRQFVAVIVDAQRRYNRSLVPTITIARNQQDARPEVSPTGGSS